MFRRINKTRCRHRCLWVMVLLLVMLFSVSACSRGNISDNDFGNGNTQTAGDNGSGNQKVQIITDGENLVIPMGEISEKAQFYPVSVNGTEMEIIAVKDSDGNIRTAFNTCQICYDSGRGYYKQQGNVLVCQNCGNRFTIKQIEVKTGGCNPYPIFSSDKTVTDDSILISYDFLEASRKIFLNWKANN